MKSIFLVARKDLPDPFFRDSVVLVTNPGGPAPVGVIINRPTDIPLARVFPDIERLRPLDEKLFFGGPVKRLELVVVFRSATRPQESIEVFDGIYLSTKREQVRELLARDDAIPGLRVFAGHAAWAPGQLEAEVARGGWHLVQADAKAVFGRNPERLWRELERRALANTVRGPGIVAPRPVYHDVRPQRDIGKGDSSWH